MLDKLPDSVGRALKGQRAGIDAVIVRRLHDAVELPSLRVHSSAFGHMDAIPPQYTADGAGLSPPLTWSGVPDGARQVLLIVEDADSPTPHPLVHAIAIMPGTDATLGSGALPSADHEGAGGIPTGLNSYLQHRWLAPDPPPAHGAHRYVFQVFALGEGNELSEDLGRRGVEEAISARAIAAGWLIGTYERPTRQSAAKGMAAIDEKEERDERDSAIGDAVVS